jgi:hypothetical protein
MTLDEAVKWVTLIVASMGGLYAGVRSAVFLTLYLYQKFNPEKFTVEDKAKGMLVDSTTMAIRSLERKFERHEDNDRKQFLAIASSLGEIKGALGIEPKHTNGGE